MDQQINNDVLNFYLFNKLVAKIIYRGEIFMILLSIHIIIFQ